MVIKELRTLLTEWKLKISLKDGELEIGFYDKGKPVVPENVQHRKLDDIKPGGLGTFL